MSEKRYHGRSHGRFHFDEDPCRLTDAELRDLKIKTLRRVLQSIPEGKFLVFYAKIEKEISDLEKIEPAA
jgi:hypothetical protein